MDRERETERDHLNNYEHEGKRERNILQDKFRFQPYDTNIDQTSKGHIAPYRCEAFVPFHSKADKPVA